MVHAEVNDTHLDLSLEGETDDEVCPSCGGAQSSSSCVVSPSWLDFLDAKREDTNRYEAYSCDQVRQTTVRYVAQCEGLTDTVVTRIFLRQAKARLPKDPFRGVTTLGLDDIADRNGRNADDLIFYNVETGTPVAVFENRTHAALIASVERLPEEILRFDTVHARG